MLMDSADRVVYASSSFKQIGKQLLLYFPQILRYLLHRFLLPTQNYRGEWNLVCGALSIEKLQLKIATYLSRVLVTVQHAVNCVYGNYSLGRK